MSPIPRYRKRARKLWHMRQQESRRLGNLETRRKSDAVERALSDSVIISFPGGAHCGCGHPVPNHLCVSWQCPCGKSGIEIDSHNPPNVTMRGPLYSAGEIVYTITP